MAFQIKSFPAITASIINFMRSATDKITDFTVGSVARTLIEAPAAEIDELYQQTFIGLREAIPVSVFQSFGFDKRPAAVARGWVSITGDPIEIPAGTTFAAADGRTYRAAEAVVWPPGEPTMLVPIEATKAGAAWNVAAGIIVSSPLLAEGYTISNAPITSGRDAESDREREARFAEMIQSLSRGTVAACEYAVRQAAVLDADGALAEYVTRVGLREEGGHVRIYTYSSRGLPSDALLADAQRRLDGWRDEATGAITPGVRAAGVRVDALPMTERAIDATIQVGMFPGYSLTDAVRQNLADVFGGALRAVPPGATLYVGSLVEDLLGVAGVRAVVPSITANIACGVDEALTPGVLTVTAL